MDDGLTLLDEGRLFSYALASQEIHSIQETLEEERGVELLRHEEVREIAGNNSVMFALTGNGQLYSWGIDGHRTGILGQGNIYNSNGPKLIQCASKLTKVSAGSKHACAVDGTCHFACSD